MPPYLLRTQCSGLSSLDNHRSINTPWMLRRPVRRYLRSLQIIQIIHRQVCHTHTYYYNFLTAAVTVQRSESTCRRRRRCARHPMSRACEDSASSGSSRAPNCATSSHAHAGCDAGAPPAADAPSLLHIYASLISRFRRAVRWCLALQDQDTAAAPRMSNSPYEGCTDVVNYSRRPRRAFRGLSRHRRADLHTRLRLLYVQPQGRRYYSLRAVIRTWWPWPARTRYIFCRTPGLGGGGLQAGRALTIGLRSSIGPWGYKASDIVQGQGVGRHYTAAVLNLVTQCSSASTLSSSSRSSPFWRSARRSRPGRPRPVKLTPLLLSLVSSVYRRPKTITDMRVCTAGEKRASHIENCWL